MQITETMKNAIALGLNEVNEVSDLNFDDRFKFARIIKYIKRIPDSANKQKLIQLEDFIKMFLKKKEEYLSSAIRNLPNSQEGMYQINVLSDFHKWLIEQTGQFKRLNAERKELLSKADAKDNEIQEYIANRWA